MSSTWSKFEVWMAIFLFMMLVGILVYFAGALVQIGIDGTRNDCATRGYFEWNDETWFCGRIGPQARGIDI